MKDFLGQELAIGDYLVMVHPQYKEMTVAKIISFTAKGAQTIYTTYSGKSTMKKLVTADQVAKIISEVAMALVLDGTINIKPLKVRK